MHLVGFIIRIYHDVQSPERQISASSWFYYKKFVERNTASILRSALKADAGCSTNIKVLQNRRPDFLRS